jgi:replicative DNA helicase
MQMAVEVNGDWAGGSTPRPQASVRTVNSLLEELRQEIYGGQRPEEFTNAQEPWGSFAFRPGDVMAIAAPPGMGKTALISQATVDALRLHAEASCLIANVEMPPKTILERQIARLSGVPYEEIARRDVLPGQRHNIDNAFATLESIGDRMAFMGPPFSIEHIVEAVAEMQPKILVLDYLQRIECCDGVADTRVRLNAVMHEVRQVANAKVCVVLISAVGRTQSKKGGGYNPNELGMGSFRESSEVEYGADDAFVMIEESGIDKATGCRTVVMRHVKSRNHRQQDIRLEFDGSIQRFTLLPDQVDDYDDDDEDGDGGAKVYRASAWVVSPEEVSRNGGRNTLPGPSGELPDPFDFGSEEQGQPKN